MLDVALGCPDGAVGSAEGYPRSDTDGVEDGRTEGEVVGLAMGTVVGPTLGEVLGLVLGTVLGEDVGTTLGLSARNRRRYSTWGRTRLRGRTSRRDGAGLSRWLPRGFCAPESTGLCRWRRCRNQRGCR